MGLTWQASEWSSAVCGTWVNAVGTAAGPSKVWAAAVCSMGRASRLRRIPISYVHTAVTSVHSSRRCVPPLL
jgi:hypothetical protein